MSELLASVIPLSIGAAFSPTVLVLIIVILGGKTAPRVRAALIVLGMAITLVFIGLAAGSMAQAVKSAGSQWKIDWLDITLGLVLLGLGVKKLITKPKPDSAPSRFARQTGSGVKPVRFLIVGVLAMATDFSSIVLFVPAVKDIVAASLSLPAKIMVGSMPFIAVLLPAIVPLLAAVLAPETADRILSNIHAWLGRHSRVISVSLAFIFGAYLLFKGASKLF
jgi:hypothetical protein